MKRGNILDVTDKSNNEWIQILEEHFKHKRKAFLVFDRDHILKHVSDYAQDILELYKDQIGCITFQDIFPQLTDNHDFLFDKDYFFQTIHNIIYTTASGRPQELRINLENEDDAPGYIVWIEAKSRDISSLYTKVSAFEPFKRLGWLFEQNQLGYLILNKDGIVQDYNDYFKKIIDIPADWIGRNFYTFPPIHQSKISEFIQNSMQNNDQPLAKVFKLKKSKFSSTIRVHWYAYPLNDIREKLIGVFVCTRMD